MKYLLMLLFFLHCFALSGQEKPVTRLLVQQVEAMEVSEAVAKSIEEAIVFDIGNRKGFSVVTSAEMNATVSFSAERHNPSC